MNYTHFIHSAKYAMIAAMLILGLILSSFLMFEPQVGRAVTDSFLVTQQITDEISFLVNTGDVTMVGSILGLTGGYATGTTYAVVRSNNSAGYNMTLGFSSTTAMSASSTAYINNYTPAVATTPDYNWVSNASGGAAEFGYTILASTTSEMDPTFLNNGSACGAGALGTADKCWMSPTTTATADTIINSNAPSISSTTTIKFKVAVPSNPSPALPEGFYVATATLTALNN